MLSRRDYLKAFCAAYLLPIGGSFAAEPKEAWSRKAFAAAGSSLQAVKRHAFLRGVFDGTLSKRTFAAYFCQNISYLDNYASCLDLFAARLSQIQGFEQEALELKQWARETRDMRVWTIDYVKSLRASRSTLLKLFLCRNCWPIRISKREPYGLPISELQWRLCCRVSGFGTNSERHCVPQPSFRIIRSEIGLRVWGRRRPMFLHERQCQLRINWPKMAQTLCVLA